MAAADADDEEGFGDLSAGERNGFCAFGLEEGYRREAPVFVL
jgi:hypothetical protein